MGVVVVVVVVVVMVMVMMDRHMAACRRESRSCRLLMIGVFPL